MKKILILVLVLPIAVSVAGIFVVTLAMFTFLGPPAGPVGPAPAGPLPIPTAMVRLYGAAALSCPGLSWAVPAAVGTVESDNGTSSAPGVASGANFAGAEGPMQFEPATFAAYALPVPPGGVSPPNPYDPTDAVYAAVRMLCADGAADPARLSQAIWDYNHSADYVSQVIGLAIRYGYPLSGGGGAGAAAVDYALSQLGTPYVWGGESTGVGFDCSGLAQAAWAAAGVALPRVAQDQYDAGPRLTAASGVRPGDLVFFGSGPVGVAHVGVVVTAGGLMVDAPHTGAVVRLEAFPVVVGHYWGDEEYVGATTPAS